MFAAKSALVEENILNFFAALTRELILWAHYPRERIRWATRYRKSPLGDKHFTLGTTSYTYFIHPYNRTWSNERAVEVPIIREYIRACADDEILEVGNVLSHYVDLHHTVVDKWEWGMFRPVINEDILTYAPARKFDLILSISTIEHIGWDEHPRKPESISNVFPKLCSLLRAGGKIILTVPIGQNLFLDQCLRDQQILPSEMFGLRRISAANEWEETTPETALQCAYGHPFPNANAIMVLIFRNNEPMRKSA